jgi:MFS family permease
MEKSGKYNFGAKGWGIVTFCFFLFWIGSGTPVLSLNVIVAKYNEIHGWDIARLHNFATAANIIAIAAAALFALWCARRGPKVIIIFGCALGAVSMFMWGRCVSPNQYAIWLSIVTLASSAYCQIGLASLVANWFPNKKGLAMGWITIGACMVALTYIDSQNFMIAHFNFPASFDLYAAAFIVLAVICILFIKNTPEEANAFPDNDRSMTREKVEALRAQGELYKKTSPWTVKKLLMTKQVWFIGIAGGVLVMFTIGIMSNFIELCGSGGIPPEKAILLLKITSLIAMPASVVWGVIDQKIGTRKTMIGMFVYFIISVGFALAPGIATLYIALIMFATVLGGANNLAVSMTAEVFGRYDFNNAWGIIFILNSLVRSFGFMLVGSLPAITGSFTGTFYGLIISSVIGAILIYACRDIKLGRSFVPDEAPKH